MRFDELGLPELLILVAVSTVYFMPWFIAALRVHHRRFMIGLLNLLLGWTLIGWLIAFLWASSSSSSSSKTKASHEEEGAERTRAIERHVPAGSAAERKYSRAS